MFADFPFVTTLDGVKVPISPQTGKVPASTRGVYNFIMTTAVPVQSSETRTLRLISLVFRTVVALNWATVLSIRASLLFTTFQETSR